MAERDAHTPNPPQVHDPTTTQTLPIFEAGTYVVQIPKDQIYRVPPPGNSLIAQRHQNPERKKQRACCSSRTCCFIVIAIFVILIALAIGLSFVLLKPKNPAFQIQNLLIKPIVSKNYSHPEYNIRLKIDNPNGRSSILYRGDGVSTLYFKEHQIATGKFPTFLQDNGDTTEVAIVVKSLGGALAQEIKESMKQKNSSRMHNISLSLKMDIPVRMKVNSFTTGDTKLVVTCDFTVDKFSKGTRILYQECHTEQH